MVGQIKTDKQGLVDSGVKFERDRVKYMSMEKWG